MTLHDLAVMIFAALCLAAAIIRQVRAAAQEADDEHSDYQPPARTRIAADFTEKE